MIAVPLKPMDETAKAELAQAIRGGHERGHALACLWLHLCHVAGVSPFQARHGGSSYRQIDRDWSPAAAKLTGGCSHALSTNLAGPTSTRAAWLYQLTLESRAASAPSAPSLF